VLIIKALDLLGNHFLYHGLVLSFKPITIDHFLLLFESYLLFHSADVDIFHVS